MEPPKYKRKIEELRRAFNRIERFYLNYIIDEDSFNGPKDYVLTFFRIGYELKEALKKTSGNPNMDGNNGEVENFVNNNLIIAIGLDITNQEKHVNLTNNRSGKKVGKINTHVHIFDPNGKDRTEMTIEIDGVKEDCLKLAKNNLKAWEDFLIYKNLI